MTKTPKTDKTFKAYKSSLDGNQDRWGYIYDMTFDEVRALPLSIQTDDQGRKFVWQYGLNN